MPSERRGGERNVLSGLRALEKATGYSLGSIRNHLAALERAELVVANRRGGLVHYFENHGRYSQSWRQVAAERDADLRRLLAWLRRHPDATQGAIIAQAARWSLTRSATQRRLERLEGYGLLEVRLDGRTRRYRLTEPAEA